MNQRMIELYREASEFAYKICREEGREGGTQDHIWNTLSTGKFAELIVRECASLIPAEQSHAPDGRLMAKIFEEHFGVNNEPATTAD